ncbi:hypothetical protein [Novosphingobium sp. PhB165]|uniref:hypothetical protein n=1 Tax=Novosphingobium sp. PhB165 TaxID=2485105 RepID=UPI001053ED4A|nr:hypothetical protein [Novosphingobium sp. PhB165]
MEAYFDVIDLNEHWHRADGAGDVVHPVEAEVTLKTLVSSGGLRGGRKVFLLGEQVTNFMFASLRQVDSALAVDAWRKLPKCVGYRLRTDNDEARIGAVAGYYDFVAIPAWHPRILLDPEVRMPPGWQQKMMNAMRGAANLSPMKFKFGAFGRDGGSPTALRFPVG